MRRLDLAELVAHGTRIGLVVSLTPSGTAAATEELGGRCEWRRHCGGSRARAYALAGDPLAEDPGCVHQPVAGGADA